MTKNAGKASYNDCEKRHEMYYELYVDSMFLVNFTMNLYLLILVNRSLMRTATRKRILLGACVGAVCYLLPFMIPLPIWIKYPAALLGGTWLMIHITFRPGTIRGYGKVLTCLLGYSFLLGGLLLFVKEMLPFGERLLMRLLGICGVGALGSMLIGYMQERERKKRLESGCIVTLIRSGQKLRVQALLDSGNGLYEPISGKPVSVIDAKVFQALWGEGEIPFRAIPYQSIGKSRGILKGYLLPELELEVDGVRKHFSDVYVAVGEESGRVPVIVNPALLELG